MSSNAILLLEGLLRQLDEEGRQQAAKAAKHAHIELNSA